MARGLNLRRGTALLALALLGAVLPAGSAGAVAPAVVRVDTRRLDFGAVAVGAASPVQVARLTNEGPGTATGLTIGIPDNPQFQRTATTCGSSLAVGATCSISLRYAPTFLDDPYANLTFFTDGGSEGLISMQGYSTGPVLAFQVTPTSFDWGRVAAGAASPIQAVVITNRSFAPQSFTFTGRNPGGGPFTSPATTCVGSPVTLAYGASCTISYRFSPTASGDFLATAPLVITQAGVGSLPYPVTLRGHGGTADGPIVQVTPRTLDFGRVAIGTDSAPQFITVTNVSPTAHVVKVNGGAASFYGPAAGTCISGQTLAAGASCTLGAIAEPETSGARASSTVFGLVVDDQPDVRVDVRYTTTGTGTAPAPVLSPADLDLGPAPVGATTATRVVTLRNQGNAALTGVTIGRTPPSDTTFEFVTNTCGATLAAGGTCSVTVRYKAADTGKKAISLTVTSAQWSGSAYLRAGPHLAVNLAFLKTASAEFLGTYPADSTFAADQAALDNGTKTRRQIIEAVAHSDAWVRAVVQRLYQDTLGRAGDAAGAGYWTNEILLGHRTVAQVAALFYASNEYYNGIGGGTDSSWIQDLYVKLLGRVADPGGTAYWVAQTVAHGRTDVAGRFYQSDESCQARVTRLYERLLGRDPDPAGRAYWAGRVVSEGDIALAVELASSSEYLRRAALLDGVFG